MAFLRLTLKVSSVDTMMILHSKAYLRVCMRNDPSRVTKIIHLLSFLYLFITVIGAVIGGAGMAHFWEHSPPTNVASGLGLICCWFSFLPVDFSLGFQSSCRLVST